MQKYEDKHFLFRSEFGWLNAIGTEGWGYTFFLQKNFTMRNLSPIENDKAFDLGAITKIISRGSIKKIHTLDLPKDGYCGIYPRTTHRGENYHPGGECEDYSKLNEEDILYLKQNQIETVILSL